MYIKQERFKAVKLRGKIFCLAMLSGFITSETVVAQTECSVTEKFFSVFRADFSSGCGNEIIVLDHEDIVFDATYFDNEQSDLSFRDSVPETRSMFQVDPLSANQQLDYDRGGPPRSNNTSSTHLATPKGFSTLEGSSDNKTEIRK